jgi:hypothetical protein
LVFKEEEGRYWSIAQPAHRWQKMSRITNQERLLMLGRNGKLKSTKEPTYIRQRDRSSIFFFAIETSGGLGRVCETIRRCQVGI